MVQHQATSDLVRSYKMENITYITDKDGNEHAIIDHGNEQFTSMLKSTYDAMQAEQSTPQGAK
jgi:hypothetical protein